MDTLSVCLSVSNRGEVVSSDSPAIRHGNNMVWRDPFLLKVTALGSASVWI